ncbi:hypothetical protein C8039_05685 [Halogeometricum sp. wsp3]|nr:hypothetical protein C8039_05685 [Halogeometricum sp. wsp3]
MVLAVTRRSGLGRHRTASSDSRRSRPAGRSGNPTSTRRCAGYDAGTYEGSWVAAERTDDTTESVSNWTRSAIIDTASPETIGESPGEPE